MSALSIILISFIPGLIGFSIIYFLYGQDDPYLGEREWLNNIHFAWRALLFSITWPLIGIVYILAELTDPRSKQKRAIQEMKDAIYSKQPRRGELSFIYGMGGKGKLYCKNCFHQEEVVSFLHGFGEDPWSSTGYQCQSCGKFHAIEYDHKLAKLPDCECGGELSREKIVFCPVCRSNNVEYKCIMIT